MASHARTMWDIHAPVCNHADTQETDTHTHTSTHTSQIPDTKSIAFLWLENTIWHSAAVQTWRDTREFEQKKHLMVSVCVYVCIWVLLRRVRNTSQSTSQWQCLLCNPLGHTNTHFLSFSLLSSVTHSHTYSYWNALFLLPSWTFPSLLP